MMLFSLLPRDFHNFHLLKPKIDFSSFQQNFSNLQISSLLSLTQSLTTQSSSPKMPKASKKNKDPNMPKRAQSAYFIWMNANRDKIKKPGMSVAEVAKAAGVEWGKLPAAEKSVWEKKAADDKKRYEQEMAAYRQQH